MGDAGFDWGKHLRADFVHDGYADASYNIGGKSAQRVPERNVEYSEDTFWDYVEQVRDRDANIVARFAARIRFEIPEETEAFKPLPMLSLLGNQTIGIVMDAGANITKELGAKNVITFGMCLDPASSPIGTDRNPIYFDPSGGRFVNIGLSQFGFDSNTIRSVRVEDVVENGMGVKTLWIMGDGSPYDPMRGRPLVAGEPIGTKRINKIGGKYSGRKQAASVYDMIGKTLGDTMIVASAMSQFDDGTANPYYGALLPDGSRYPGIWKNLSSGTPVTNPEDIPASYVVKTGDRLNAVRAIFKNVPVILEKYEGDRVIKIFDYYPAEARKEPTLVAIPISYGKMVGNVTKRYNDLIDKFQNAYERAPGGPKLKGAHSRFVVEEVSTHPTTLIRTDERQLSAAGRLFERIQERLGFIKTKVERYFQERGANAYREIFTEEDPPTIRPDAVGNFEAIMRNYNRDLALLKNLCPQTDVILRDERTKVMNPIIPITQGDVEVIPNMEIRLLSAFQAIKNGVDIDSPAFRETTYFKRFEGRLVEEGPVPPAGGVEGELLDAYAQDIIGEGTTAGGRRGGAHTIVFNRESDEMNAVLGTTAPILKRFVEYCAKHIGALSNQENYARELYNLIPHADSPRIASSVLLRRVVDEFRHLAETGAVILESEFPDFSARDAIPSTLMQSTHYSLIYNAFSMNMNRLNVRGADIGFGYLEDIFLAAAATEPGPVPRAREAAAPHLYAAAGAPAPREAPPEPTPANRKRKFGDSEDSGYTTPPGESSQRTIATLSPGARDSPPYVYNSPAAEKARQPPTRRARSSSWGGRRKTYRLKKKSTK